jgi:ribonuclease HI
MTHLELSDHELGLMDRLDAIKEMVELAIVSDKNMSVNMKILLERISAVAQGKEDELQEEVISVKLDHIIISCDASITKNPGGQASIAFCIQDPNREENFVQSKKLPNYISTSNAAEYAAIYEAIATLLNVNYIPRHHVEIRSDSQLVIRQLQGKYKCNDENLAAKRDAILELLMDLPAFEPGKPSFSFVWRPRCSTPELRLVNFEAQKAIGVRPH